MVRQTTNPILRAISNSDARGKWREQRLTDCLCQDASPPGTSLYPSATHYSPHSIPQRPATCSQWFQPLLPWELVCTPNSATITRIKLRCIQKIYKLQNNYVVSLNFLQMKTTHTSFANDKIMLSTRFHPYTAEILCINHGDQGFFQFEIILNV